MTQFVVGVLAEAEQEFSEAFRWYFERSPVAAEAFRTRVMDAIDGLADHAELWPANEDGLHFHVRDRFPYTVWHDVDDQVVTVVAVAHQHRRPDYWKTRGQEIIAARLLAYRRLAAVTCSITRRNISADA